MLRIQAAQASSWKSEYAMVFFRLRTTALCKRYNVNGPCENRCFLQGDMFYLIGQSYDFYERTGLSSRSMTSQKKVKSPLPSGKDVGLLACYGFGLEILAKSSSCSFPIRGPLAGGWAHLRFRLSGQSWSVELYIWVYSSAAPVQMAIVTSADLPPSLLHCISPTAARRHISTKRYGTLSLPERPSQYCIHNLGRFPSLSGPHISAPVVTPGMQVHYSASRGGQGR